jgi:hypothetical protein
MRYHIGAIDPKGGSLSYQLLLGTDTGAIDGGVTATVGLSGKLSLGISYADDNFSGAISYGVGVSFGFGSLAGGTITPGLAAPSFGFALDLFIPTNTPDWSLKDL